MTMRPFTRLLVANRGEIAARVIRTARDEGYETVAVHSDLEPDAPHVALADQAVCIGPAAPAESYLNQAALIAAARATGADAVHPGYGFLSENADFAEAVDAAGLVWVGPTAESIRLMGDKAAAKQAMAAAGVPLLPGYDGADQSHETLTAQARRIGFPLMVKAVAGGGGRGMRLVTGADALPHALDSARREAESAFGDGRLILERAVAKARHVEVQILGDGTGRVLHLHERDCSLQRRHQKVIEEAPAPGLPDASRAALLDAAIKAGEAVRYRGAGTVEFLYDPAEDRIAFLEMNTRLQVEHPVTEAITGLDLVACQLAVASGAGLPVTQDDVRLDGHAVEARLYAEDPTRDFQGGGGPVPLFNPPAGPGIRVDAGIASGGTVPTAYDPMMAKIIAHGRDRAEALRRLNRALGDLVLLGPASNLAFLRRLLLLKDMAEGTPHTGLIADHMAPLTAPDPNRQSSLLALAALLALDWAPDDPLSGFGGLAGPGFTLALAEGDHIHVLGVAPHGNGFTLTLPDGRAHDLRALSRHGNALEARLDGARLTGAGHRVADPGGGETLHVWTRGDHRRYRDISRRPAEGDRAANGALTAPMTGTVTAIHAENGAALTKGDAVLTLEAMKMEHTLTAPLDGILHDLTARAGDQVAGGHVLARIVAATDPETSTREPTHE
ncbi:acetyl/propionyl/methylcrotonyl-CoA carboxylase subunit alpha [Yunchengibacter salinarum]|uniref:acetyl/propionyl/methylcrotonyl-CoA carboxylase subunit alpha n=1 Tax=Yunchengibacter salinarum TaxID=3133399 RepID=UPI0035B662A6